MIGVISYTCSTDWAKEAYQCRHWSTFPGRHQPSIIDASELNCRVRNGNGCDLTAISTDLKFGDPYQNRTGVTGVRGRCLNRLTNGPKKLVHHRGLEPRTHWLRVSCSTNWANGAFTSLIYYIINVTVCQAIFSKFQKKIWNWIKKANAEGKLSEMK